MAVHLLRDRKRHRPGDETGTAPRRALVRRDTADRGPVRRRYGHNPVSALVWLAAWAAALTLLAGMGLTWADADTSNTLVQNILDVGHWLATPFADVFTHTDPGDRLYANWGLAAAVYYVLGRVLSWLIRR